MKHISVHFFIFLFTFASVNARAFEIKHVRNIKIDQSSEIIGRVSNICVIHDKYYALVDSKTAKLNIYTEDGKLKKTLGRKGLGPEEFYRPIQCDYENGRLIILDYGKYKIFLFNVSKDLKFRKIGEFFLLNLGYDLKLYRDRIYISGYEKDAATNEEYDLFSVGIGGKKQDYFLPSHLKYGAKSPRTYNRDFLKKYAVFGMSGFFDVRKDEIYFCWVGDLRISKININTKEITFFGKKTENYIQPRVTSRLKRLYKSRSRKLFTEYQKMSYVNKVFCTDSSTYVMYSNYKKETGWEPIVQSYTSDGKFNSENKLIGSFNNSNYAEPAAYFLKDRKVLVYLSRAIDEDFNDVYTINEFQIIE